MTNPRLTEREELLLHELQKGVRDALDLLGALKKAGHKPRGGTRSLSVSIRYLGYKIAPAGYYITRISGLGRGNMGRYQLHYTTERSDVLDMLADLGRNAGLSDPMQPDWSKVWSPDHTGMSAVQMWDEAFIGGGL